MGDIFGNFFKISSFGESHGKAVGVVVSGLPAGIELKQEEIQKELDRRKPGQSKITTRRQEKDSVEILSGLFENMTTGTALCMIVYNKDAKSDSYEPFKDLYRPSHADFTYEAKYGHRDWRGGGRASARETIARVAAGAIGRKILRDFYQVEVVSWVSQVHKIRMEMEQKPWTRQEVDANLVRCPHLASAEKMQSEIEQMQRMGDSVGGVISARISNPPPGLGSPVFDRFEADLAKAMLSIPATKGFEIGSGFAGVEMTGSEHNDIFIPKKKYKGEPQIGTQTNNSGGVQGGITNGEDVFFRVAFKPTATIFKEMDTVNQAGKPMKIKPKGRHDTCVLPRAVPIVDAMACLVTLDHILAMEAYHRFGPQISAQRKAKKIN